MKNGESTLAKCLKSLVRQTLQEVEIIVLDSESTDNSVDIAKEFGAAVYSITAESFNHGLTRNLGVQHAKGHLIFLTVQDAWIAENDMLENMAQHFEHDDVMSVVGHQAVPHENDKNPMQWFRRYSEPIATKRKHNSGEDFETLSVNKKKELIAWDNVVAMYRKSALVEQPFAETQFAEDWIWSRAALIRGWTLVHDPLLIVYHYHHQSYQYAYKVAYAVNYHFYKFFGFKPDLPALFNAYPKVVYHLAKHPILNFKEKLYWIGYNFRAQLGTYNSHFNFLWNYFLGGKKAIEKRYHKVCKTVPQGKQNINNL